MRYVVRVIKSLSRFVLPTLPPPFLPTPHVDNLISYSRGSSDLAKPVSGKKLLEVRFENEDKIKVEDGDMKMEMRSSQVAISQQLFPFLWCVLWSSP